MHLMVMLLSRRTCNCCNLDPVGKEQNSRKKKKNAAGEDVEEMEAEVMPSNGSSSGSKARMANDKGDKFRALKAREAAAKARESASVGAGSASSSEPPSSGSA